MPPRRRAPAPIPVDIEAIRRKLDEGKIVRVGISKSAQFPDGGTGRVRHVGDPEVDGEEFVQVELSLNGTRDVLPFTPGDLTPATRARSTPAAAPVQLAARGTSTRTSSAAGRALRSAAPAAPPAPTNTAPDSASTAPDSADTAPAATGIPSALAGDQAGTPAEPGKVPVVRSRGTRAPRRTPRVSITIATADTEPTQWRIEARVGARVVLRSGTVAPARVWELVRLLDDPTLIGAVGGILEEQRKAAQARADALAAELLAVRAELAALPDGNVR